MDHYRNTFIAFNLSLYMLFPLLQGCIVAAAGTGAAGTAAVATDRRTVGTIVDDQTIEVKAIHAISRNPILWKQSHISVMCYNGVLLLVGQTPTEELKKEAFEVVSEIPKIRQIHNELTVDQPISFATRSKDSWITTQIKTKLIGNKQIRAHRIKVITEDGVVYLMGLTTPEEEMIATDIARAIPGVDKVVQIFETIAE
jgi:osmotically-inducible protein OsmY